MDVPQERLDKRDGFREAGHEPYPVASGFEGRQTVAQALELDADADPPPAVTVVGRITARRDFGKVMFLDLRDGTGRIQLYLQKKRLPEGRFMAFRDHLDLGDFLGVTGELSRTKTGEATVFATDVELLSKSLRPLPKEHFGLSDTETRYRQRYADLASNPETGARFKARSALIAELRGFLIERDFMEVETPLLHPISGGATARPFTTHHNTLDLELFLRIAPELYLKRLLVGGFERVFEIGRNFRNEGLSPRHNPEFTMLEAYWAYGRADDWMAATEEALEQLVVKHGGISRQEDDTETAVRRGEQLVDFKRPFARKTYAELVSEHADANIFDPASVEAAATRLGIDTAGKGRAKLIDDVFSATVEEHLVQPTFVTEFPIEMSPLAKARPEDARVADRFELFIAGMEVANGFSELNDPAEQLSRFEAQVAAKDPELPGEVDHDYVRALCYGMPPATGIGIGVDRLAMLLTGVDTIRDVILFPLLRPRPIGEDEPADEAPAADGAPASGGGSGGGAAAGSGAS